MYHIVRQVNYKVTELVFDENGVTGTLKNFVFSEKIRLPMFSHKLKLIILLI